MKLSFALFIYCPLPGIGYKFNDMFGFPHCIQCLVVKIKCSQSDVSLGSFNSGHMECLLKKCQRLYSDWLLDY